MQWLDIMLDQIIVYGTVYILTSLGIVIAGRTGIFNITAEGVIVASASMSFVVAVATGNWVMGFIAGALLGALFGLIFIFFHEYFKVDQFVLGICLTIFGMGFSDLLYKLVFGITLTTPKSPVIKSISIPLLSKIPIVSAIVNQDVVVYIMYLSVIVSFWFFYRTKIGLETKAIGENPKAADIVGVGVLKSRYIASIIGSSLMAMSGSYLVIRIAETYTPGIAAGRGFMAIGLAIFSSWAPNRVFWGGILFAAIEVLSYTMQMFAKNVPYQFFLMLPFILVLIVMMIFRKQVQFPASVGESYSRE